MNNYGLVNDTKIALLNISGSSDITTKNESGVYVFSGSVADDGIIFGKMTKPNYNNSELVKTIDTNIYELIPKVKPTPIDLVPRYLWTNEQASHSISKEIIYSQMAEISNLNGRILDLNMVTQSLRVQLDAQSLLAASAQNQAAQSTSRVKTSITELQNALQKSTSEVIQRVSVSAVNKSLQDDVDVLRDQLFGRSAKLQEGYKAANDFAVKVINTQEPSMQDVVFQSKQSSNGTVTWINGNILNIYNYSNNGITVSIVMNGTAKKLINPISNITIPANSSQDVSLYTTDSTIENVNHPAGDADYRGSITITSLVSKSTVTLTTAFHSINGNVFQAANAQILQSISFK